MSTLTLVDLAGSERIAKTGAEGQRMKEVRCRSVQVAVVAECAMCFCACLSGHEPVAAGWQLAPTGIAAHPPMCLQWLQGAAINKSLLTLGTVINKLSEGVQATGAGGRGVFAVLSIKANGRQSLGTF